MTILYPFVMLAALLACAILLRRSQARLPLRGFEKLGIGLGAFCGAMIAAKLPFVFSDVSGLLSGTAWFMDGKTILCGLVGGYLGVEVAKWVLDIRVKTGDTFAVPCAVAVAIGRVGCFTAGCCYGTPTTLPWGVRFSQALDSPSVFRHPTQLYETAFHLMCAALLLWLGWRGIWKGQLVKAYILAYLAYRFLTEWIRPEAHLLGGLTGYQWATLVLAPLFAWLWWRDARVVAENARPGVDAWG